MWITVEGQDGPVHALMAYGVGRSIDLLILNLWVPELFFLILAHPVYKMWIIQEPNTL